MTPPDEMTAADFFSLAPKYRTKERLNKLFATARREEHEALTEALIRIFSAETLGDAVNQAWDAMDPKAQQRLIPKL